MGLFALITRWLPKSRRREQRVSFAANPRAPRKLERRRVLDAAGAGVMVDAIIEDHPYVQVSDNLVPLEETSQPMMVGDPSEGLSPPLPDASLVAQFPSITLQLSSNEVFENDFVVLDVQITDSQPQVHTVQVDLGDGSPTRTFVLQPNVTRLFLLHQYKDDNPTGTSMDTNTIKATVTNSFGEMGSVSADVLVKNVAPQLESLSITNPIDENGTATLTGTYSDIGTLDTHKLDIDWNGDGSYDQTVSVTSGVFSVSHQYLDDNPTNTANDTFNVNVRLRDDDTGQDTGSVSLTVNNVAPKIDSLTITNPINENGTATLAGTYSDVGILDTHRLDIDWNGDGSYDQTVTVTGGTFSVSHQYLDDVPTEHAK